MLEFQNTKTFLLKDTLQIGQKKFLLLVKLKRKGIKLYVKFKGYDNSFNSWTDKKDIV